MVTNIFPENNCTFSCFAQFFPLTVASAFLANKHAKAFGQRILGAKAVTSFRHTPRLGKPQMSRDGSVKAGVNGSGKDVE
jgi:hypothetical protein